MDDLVKIILDSLVPSASKGEVGVSRGWVRNIHEAKKKSRTLEKSGLEPRFARFIAQFPANVSHCQIFLSCYLLSVLVSYFSNINNAAIGTLGEGLPLLTKT